MEMWGKYIPLDLLSILFLDLYMIKYLIKVILRQRSLFPLSELGRLYGYFSQDCDLAFNPTWQGWFRSRVRPVGPIFSAVWASLGTVTKEARKDDPLAKSKSEDSPLLCLGCRHTGNILPDTNL